MIPDRQQQHHRHFFNFLKTDKNSLERDDLLRGSTNSFSDNFRVGTNQSPFGSTSPSSSNWSKTSNQNTTGQHTSSSSHIHHHRSSHYHHQMIKRHLEDAFKQNGFLVKTKQVSDPNNSATFCKFRQLRKYTRYYLKSWQNHLPDEVNKLWKGFLPPKSERPLFSTNTNMTTETLNDDRFTNCGNMDDDTDTAI